MSRAGHPVFRDATAWREITRHNITILSGCRYRDSKGMKFLQPREIKTEVLDRGLGFVDGKVSAIHLQQLGWTRSRPEALNQGLGWVCAVLSEHCREVHCKLFAFLLTVKAPLSRVSNRTVWSPACSRFNIT